MEIVDVLKKKNIKVREIPKWGTYLRKQWENHFASHMSEEEKKSIYLHNVNGAWGYLWHLFSYEKRESLIGNEADQAFQDEQKNACYVFYQHTDDALILGHASHMTVDDLLDETDIYVVDKDFTWTYVRTHEKGWCGPYFSRRTESLR